MTHVFEGRFKITTHAIMEMSRRGLTIAVIEAVLKDTGQKLAIRQGRMVYQSVQTFPPDGKEYLVRVFVDIDRNPAEVVTAYRTTRVKKYWR